MMRRVGPSASVIARSPDSEGVEDARVTDSTRRSRDGERLLESLTDKQRRALEVAYFSGYFERPRNHDTTDVATKRDISRQTLTQHLRAGERKLFVALFDDSDP